MEYSEQYLPYGNNRCGKAMRPTTYTIHSTGNANSTAQNERNWLTNPSNTRTASYHSVVDQTRCIRVIPFSEVAWHAGTAAGNHTSLSLEICESGNREQTLQNAIEVVAGDLKSLGWGVERLRQHHDWRWANGYQKNCPRILRDTGLWDWFVQQVERRLKGEDDMTTEQVREITQAVVLQMLSGEGTAVSSWAKEAWQQAEQSGLTDGSRPGGYATREQVVQMLARMKNDK